MASESTSTLEPIKSHLSHQSLANKPLRPTLNTKQSTISQVSLISEVGKGQRSRWVLQLQARMWRILMKIGMVLPTLGPPRPIKPTFSRVIPTTISPKYGEVRIQFYTPPDYYVNLQLGRRYPAVVNFHGGGFTLGTATDDSRWASAIVYEVEAVVASVEYRLAPEFPFPTAVEDGVDAVMYLAANATKLGIDRNKIAVSGFSSGGNMAFTVPLRLQQELNPDFVKGNMEHMGDVQFESRPQTPKEDKRDRHTFLSPNDVLTPKPVRPSVGRRADTRTVVRTVKPFSLAAIVAWYPPTDYTLTRDERRATSSRPDQQLSSTFTELFDQSYLPPVSDRSSPYLSPGVAPESMLRDLPQNIVVVTCEYDMLVAEAQTMCRRLESLSKTVTYKMVPGVQHGWDKKPNPFRRTKHVKEFYLDACMDLREAFGLNIAEDADGGLKGVVRRMSTVVRKSLQVPRNSLGRRTSLGARTAFTVGEQQELEEYEDEDESRRGR